MGRTKIFFRRSQPINGHSEAAWTCVTRWMAKVKFYRWNGTRTNKGVADRLLGQTPQENWFSTCQEESQEEYLTIEVPRDLAMDKRVLDGSERRPYFSVGLRVIKHMIRYTGSPRGPRPTIVMSPRDPAGTGTRGLYNFRLIELHLDSFSRTLKLAVREMQSSSTREPPTPTSASVAHEILKEYWTNAELGRLYLERSDRPFMFWLILTHVDEDYINLSKFALLRMLSTYYLITRKLRRLQKCLREGEKFVKIIADFSFSSSLPTSIICRFKRKKKNESI